MKVAKMGYNELIAHFVAMMKEGEVTQWDLAQTAYLAVELKEAEGLGVWEATKAVASSVGESFATVTRYRAAYSYKLEMGKDFAVGETTTRT